VNAKLSDAARASRITFFANSVVGGVLTVPRAELRQFLRTALFIVLDYENPHASTVQLVVTIAEQLDNVEEAAYHPSRFDALEAASKKLSGCPCSSCSEAGSALHWAIRQYQERK
jgi:hypothetical protein